MIKLPCALLCLTAVAISAPVNAAITFHLSGISLADGAKVTGSITTDDEISKLTNYSITTGKWKTGGFGETVYEKDEASNYFGTFYSNRNKEGDVIKNNALWFNHGSSILFLFFDRTIGRDGANFVDAYEDRTNDLTRGGSLGGSIGLAAPVAGAVPEPATWVMMLLGFGGIGFAMRRRKTKLSMTVSYA